MSATSSPLPAASSRKRRIFARVLTILAIVLATISLVAGYVRWQVFDNGTFKNTSAQLLESQAIREQVAGTLVDRLYANVDVQAELEAKLPPDQRGLAAPLAGALRQLGERTAYQMLGRPRVQKLFVAAVADAQRQVDRALKDDLRAVSTQNGVIVLDLEPVVLALGDQLSFLGNLKDRLPPDVGLIEIAPADRFETAQELTRLFRSIAAVLPFLALALAGCGIALARGRRRREIGVFAIGIIAGGVLVLVGRGVAGGVVVDKLAGSSAAEPAARDAWRILTELLADGAWTAIILGVAGLVGVWLSASRGSGKTVRLALAPTIARRSVGYPALLGLYLLLLLWEPTAQFGRPLNILVFAVLLAIGLEALRRLVLAENPDAGAVSPGDALQGLMRRRGGGARGEAPADLASQLDRVVALHASGALNDEDFAAAKAHLLQ